MRVKLKAVLHSVKDVEEKDNYKRQKIEFEVKKFDTDTGEAKDAKYFPATIFNKRINELDAAGKVGNVVNAVCYLDSFKTEKDGETWHNLALTCVELDLV